MTPPPPQHSMIYFFHHYELPAILQQIRIQEMLLQNQQAGQAGQANQTALQDNLNNNNHNAAAAAAAPAPGPEQGPANTTQPGPPTNLQPPSSSSLAVAGGGGEMRSELNWVAQTAAIITEALSNQQPSSTDPGDEPSGGQGAVGGQGVEEVSMVAEFWMGGGGGGGGEDDLNDVLGAMKPTAGGSNPPIRGHQPQEAGPSEVGPPQTDSPPPQSQDIDWNCRAAEQGPAL